MIEGKAVVKFGTGDVLITPLVKEDFSSGCVVLQNKGTHVVGEYSQNFEKSEDDTILSFSSVESLDVFIDRLERLKLMMSGDLKGCLSPIEYDY